MLLYLSHIFINSTPLLCAKILSQSQSHIENALLKKFSSPEFSLKKSRCSSHLGISSPHNITSKYLSIQFFFKISFASFVELLVDKYN
jgi:hypothetical protein